MSGPVITLASDVGFAEGPVVTQAGDIVVTSVTGGCLYRIGPGGPQLLAETGGGPNGAAEGLDGALYVAQNGGYGLHGPPDPSLGALAVAGGVQLVRRGDAVEWLTLYPVSANDLCFGPDGLLYVTDPTRGREDDSRIWRCDPATGEAELMLSVPWYANGIGFGREDDALYVVSTTHSRLVRYAIDGDRLRAPETVIQMAHNKPDGFAFDSDGNATFATFAIGGTGDVQTWSLAGELLDIVEPASGSFITNVAIAPDRRLIITAGDAQAVLAVDDWPSAPLPLHPFRG